jgi:hypothetical protein
MTGMNFKIKLGVASLFFFVLLLLASQLTVWESLSCSLMFFCFFAFVEDLGKKIVIMDYAVLMMVGTCLVLPVLFYHEYQNTNKLARLWNKFMPITSDDYFEFAFPAVVAMVIGIRFTIKRLRINEHPVVYMNNVKNYLKTRPNLGLSLIAVGVVSGFLDFLSPSSLAQVFNFSEHLTYVGVFYVIYSPFKYKRFIVPGVIALMFGQSLITGMFGDMVNMAACSLPLILLGNKKITFKSKLLFISAGVFVVLLIQSVKAEYRQRTWISNSGGDPVFFAELIADRFADIEESVDPDNMFFLSVRLNQGWLVAYTMKKVPQRYPFAYGETILNSVEASIIPRFLWPDKPKAGGVENLRRFWGYNIKGYSMNIGPLGEAYANFDVLGGIIYMLFYGLFFNFMLSSILKYSEKRPTIVLWLPYLFYFSISVETDTLSTMGYLIKGVFFTWLVFQFYRIAFRLDL